MERASITNLEGKLNKEFQSLTSALAALSFEANSQQMKRVLLLGSGLVAAPFIKYLSQFKNIKLTIGITRNLFI